MVKIEFEMILPFVCSVYIFEFPVCLSSRYVYIYMNTFYYIFSAGYMAISTAGHVEGPVTTIVTPEPVKT